MESQSCPEIVPGGVPGLWELIARDCKIGLQRGLNQTCSPRRYLSNDVSHSQFRLWEKVDSWLLMVGSQTASLTPGLSFAHNLGDICPNGRCEAIFDIYASRPFQRHQEQPNARCFGSWCRALNIRESRRTPNPQLFQVLGFTPTLGQVRVATLYGNYMKGARLKWRCLLFFGILYLALTWKCLIFQNVLLVYKLCKCISKYTGQNFGSFYNASDAPNNDS